MYYLMHKIKWLSQLLLVITSFSITLSSAQVISEPSIKTNHSEPTNQSHPLMFEILVSAQLNDTLLTKIFEEAHFYRAKVVVRGLLPEKTLSQTMAFWQKYAIKHNPPVAVLINPITFQQMQATTVPMLIARAGDAVIASVIGIYSIDWLTRHIDAKLQSDTSEEHSALQKKYSAQQQAHHFGTQGPSHTILEIDLVEQMQYQVSQVDWDRQKQLAFENYAFNASNETILPAINCTTRYLNPTLILTEPLLDEKGSILVAKGTKINPLNYLPFKQQLIIFNPNHASEIEEINHFLRRLRTASTHFSNPITLIATHLEPKSGWQMLERLETQFQLPVYLLTQPIQTRFEINATPTLITQEKQQFKLQIGCF